MSSGMCVCLCVRERKEERLRSACVNVLYKLVTARVTNGGGLEVVLQAVVGVLWMHFVLIPPQSTTRSSAARGLSGT